MGEINLSEFGLDKEEELIEYLSNAIREAIDEEGLEQIDEAAEEEFKNIHIKSIDVVCPHCNYHMPLDEMSENKMCCICGLSMEIPNE